MNNKNQLIKIMSLNCAGLTTLTETQIKDFVVNEQIHITLLQETKRSTKRQTEI
jgi:exonuclease III